MIRYRFNSYKEFVDWLDKRFGLNWEYTAMTHDEIYRLRKSLSRQLYSQGISEYAYVLDAGKDKFWVNVLYVDPAYVYISQEYYVEVM